MHVQTAFISLSTAGYILMIAGVVVFVIGLALVIRGRRTVTTSRIAADPVAAQNLNRTTTRSSDPRDV